MSSESSGKTSKTLKEWFGDATRGDGRRFRCCYWHASSKGWFEPIFLADYNRDGGIDKNVWHGVDENGEYDSWMGDNPYLFQLYTEPKKTETRWLWADKDGYIHQRFSTMPLRTLRNRSVGTDIVCGIPLERLRNEDVFFDVKLDWSATQFEVE